MADERHQESNFRCADCEASFSCRHLLTALTILDSHIATESPDPQLVALRDRLTRKLATLGWQFPAGKRPCALHGREDLIRDLTEEIIGALEATGAKGGRSGDKGALYREVLRG